MTYLIEIEKPMETLLNAIKKDRSLLTGPKTTGFSDTRITAQNLEDAAGNHFFDDGYWKFGITEMDAHKIRAYFQEGINYDFVIELHRRFPAIMEMETEDFMEIVNKRRKRVGLSHIHMSIIVREIME